MGTVVPCHVYDARTRLQRQLATVQRVRAAREGASVARPGQSMHCTLGDMRNRAPAIAAHSQVLNSTLLRSWGQPWRMGAVHVEEMVKE